MVFLEIYRVRSEVPHWFARFDAIRLCMLWCGDATNTRCMPQHVYQYTTVGVEFLSQAIGIEVRSPVALVLVRWRIAVLGRLKDHRFQPPANLAWNGRHVSKSATYIYLPQLCVRC